MQYDYIRFLNDFNIPYDDTIAMHRGFITVACPFCNSSEKYGGININFHYFSCWKCRSHKLKDYIQLVTGLDWYTLRREYHLEMESFRDDQKIITPDKITLPFGLSPLNDQARKYLLIRGFDPDQLVDDYKIMSTNHLGDYKFRIIIPIYFNHKLVSYTSRDYTNKAELRYYSCKKENEIMDHKKLLYGYDQAINDFVIVVEGPLDKWKMGLDSVATFGIGYKKEQINLLTKFKRIVLLFDNEPQAQKMAHEIGDVLAALGREVENVVLEKNDPGGLTQNEANFLLKKIKK